MKHIISCLLIGFTSPLFGTTDSTQKYLGTLFTTPHVRNQLNKQRSRGKFDSQTHADLTAKSNKPITVKVQGVVIRKAHNPVVFVNDSNTLKSQKVNGEITVKFRNVLIENYKVPIRINDNYVRLKPGQQWSESNKSVKEIYKVKTSDTHKQDDK